MAYCSMFVGMGIKSSINHVCPQHIYRDGVLIDCQAIVLTFRRVQQ